MLHSLYFETRIGYVENSLLFSSVFTTTHSVRPARSRVNALLRVYFHFTPCVHARTKQQQPKSLDRSNRLTVTKSRKWRAI